MQTPKPRNGASDAPQRTSPSSSKSYRVTKKGDSECDPISSKSTPTKNPIDKSPKTHAHRSPQSPGTEKKRPSRASELESQLNQLRDDLKKAKDQLGASESLKRRAHEEAEEAKKQLSTMSSRLEDSQRQIVEFSAAEESRLQELRKISQDRDRAWQAELEAIQKQHSMDSSALSNAINEIHRLKHQLEIVVKSEAHQLKQSEAAHSELQELKRGMTETLSIVENLKTQLQNSENAEAEAQVMIHATQQQLELAKANIEDLHANGLKLMDSLSSASFELEATRARAIKLDETVKKLQEKKVTEGVVVSDPSEYELEQLRSAVEAAEMKFQEEQFRNTLQVRSAYELVDRVKIESGLREADLESALKNAKAEIFELKTDLIDKETELQSVSDMNKGMSSEMEKIHESMEDTSELKANLMDKETELQSISEENELLKSEIRKRDSKYEAAMAEVELARAQASDASMRLQCSVEESDKKAARVVEQLEAAQAMKSEMEAELRRLRVQSDQWRKAAEAAAAALASPTNNGSSFDPEYPSVGEKMMSSPFSDDESPKKKNSSVLRRIGGLWKKSPK